LGHYLNLHTYYCNNGDACDKKSKKTAITTPENLILESFLESTAFIILGNILLWSLPNMSNIIIYFIIGIVLHIVSELLGIHKSFCNKRCLS
jgi:hypothetical protein